MATRIGAVEGIQDALDEVNRVLLATSLHRLQAVTLDIDATEVEANKASAKWTYKGHRGYMPMVGHIVETDQVVAVDFRDGNTPPNKDNLAFIQRCKEALPTGIRMKALRTDAAGYQEDIIRYCDAHDTRYVIRATMSGALKSLAMEADEDAWQPLLDQKGKPADQETFHSVHCIGDYEQAFTVVLQRQAKRGPGT